MKKAVIITLLAIAITFSFSFFGTDSVAYAEETTPVQNGTYRAAGDIDVYTYVLRGGTSVEKLLFTIPSTYYFDLTNYEGVYSVTYNGKSDNYFIKPDANFVALTEKDIGTLGGFSVELELTADCTFNNRDGMFITDTAITVAETTAISFIGYGKNSADVDCAYVLYNNASYGYIPKANLKIKGTTTMLADYTIDFHPNYRTTVSDKPAGDKETPDNAKLIRIVLIVGIVVPALVIMFLLFKPSKKSRYDYDRNRGYDMGNSPYDRPRSRYRDDYYDDYDRPAPPRGRRDDYDDYDDRGRRY